MQTKKISLANIQGKLSRSEMKNIMAGSGGIVSGYIKGLIGWIGPDANGNCWCDFCNSAVEGGVSCGQWCPAAMCTPGSIDPYAYAWCYG